MIILGRRRDLKESRAVHSIRAEIVTPSPQSHDVSIVIQVG
jgi:hypothetical protein